MHWRGLFIAWRSTLTRVVTYHVRGFALQRDLPLHGMLTRSKRCTIPSSARAPFGDDAMLIVRQSTRLALDKAPHSLRHFVRRYPVLHRFWGMLRWYTSPSGFDQVTTRVRHVGWTVQCPFCGWRGNSYYPHPQPHPRPNAVCPRCGSKERHRLLFLYLKEWTDLFRRPLRVLEIAPGPYSLRLSRMLSKTVYVTLDYESPLAMLRGDIADLPFAKRCFDLVICYHVLEHVADDHRAMAECDEY